MTHCSFRDVFCSLGRDHILHGGSLNLPGSKRVSTGSTAGDGRRESDHPRAGLPASAEKRNQCGSESVMMSEAMRHKHLTALLESIRSRERLHVGHDTCFFRISKTTSARVPANCNCVHQAK